MPTKHVQWEYEVREIPNTGPASGFAARLTTLGSDGWEFAAILKEIPGHAVVLLKRQKT